MKSRVLSPIAALLAFSGGWSTGNDTVARPAQATAPRSNLSYDAEGVPVFRPGLWDIINDEGESTKVCMTAGLADELREQLFTKREGCTQEIDRADGALRISGQCPKDGMTITAAATIVGDQTQYMITLDLGFARPGQAPVSQKMTMRSRWISACPVGMQQGDVLQEDQ